MTDCNAEAVDIKLTWRSTRDSVMDLERLYDEHSESLYRYALAVTGSREDAEDAVQDFFAVLARCNPTAAKIDNLRFYLLAGVRNAAITILRRRKRRNEQNLDEDEPDNPCANPCSDTLNSLLLKDAFEKLPSEQREVIVLKVYEGMTLAEIAAAVGASIGTISSRYGYALRKLRIALEEKADER